MLHICYAIDFSTDYGLSQDNYDNDVINVVLVSLLLTLNKFLESPLLTLKKYIPTG